MKLDQLTYFLETARHEHVGKAAKALAISPSAISHSITALEEELGRSLFVKEGRKLQLTAHGKLLMERARLLLSEVEDIKEEIHSDQVELRGHYRIGGVHLICARYVAPTWSAIQTQNERLTSEIFTLRSAQVVSSVASGELDLGICFSPQAHPSLQVKHLFSGKLRIVVGKRHPMRGHNLSKLSEFPAVLPKAFQGIDVCESHPMFERYGIEPKPICLFDSYEVALETISGSQAWGFLPDIFIEMARGQVRALPLPEDWDAPYSVSAVWPRSRQLTPVLEHLLEQLSGKFYTAIDYQ